MPGIRQTEQYKQCRKAMLNGKKCVKCNSEKNLQIHHIKTVKTHPHLIYCLDNIKILCKNCHKLEHKITAKRKK